LRSEQQWAIRNQFGYNSLKLIAITKPMLCHPWLFFDIAQLVSSHKNPWALTFEFLGNRPMVLPPATPLLITFLKAHYMCIKVISEFSSVKLYHL
jgi:hypothetical protein